MGIKPKTEEEQKKAIFTVYSQLREESSSDRRQVYFPQLLEKVFKWSIDYYHKEKTMEYGLEINDAVLRIIKAESTRKMPKDEQELFKYLATSLEHAKNEYLRNYEEGNIHIPKGQRQKLKEITDFIAMEESELGRKLSEYEKEEKAARWFNIPKDEARKYLELRYMKKTVPLTRKKHSNGEEKYIDILEFVGIHPNTQRNEDNPAKIHFSNFETTENKQKFKEVLESVFASKGEKTMPFYRALFTAQCLDTSADIEWMQEYLDTEMLETYKKRGTKPTNREIFIKYHPESNNPDQSASKRLKEFRDLLEAAQKEKGLQFVQMRTIKAD